METKLNFNCIAKSWIFIQGHFVEVVSVDGIFEINQSLKFTITTDTGNIFTFTYKESTQKTVGYWLVQYESGMKFPFYSFNNTMQELYNIIRSGGYVYEN